MDTFELVKNCVCFSDNRMVYKYVRKSTRQSWTEDNMLHAIEAATSGAMGVVHAGKLFGVPKSTLHRRLKGKNKMGAWCLQRDGIPADGPATKH